jgi:hypothetical protein
MQYLTSLDTIFSAQAATGTGKAINVENWEKILIEIATASSANLTVLIQGSISDTAPDFSASRTASNMWDYLSFEDSDELSSNLPVKAAGSSGFVVTGTDSFKNVVIVYPNVKWLCATVTARAAGSVTVKARGVKNVN